MILPFKYGKVVSGKSFANRTDKLKQLSTNFNALINTILISPRRWGKSSLVRKAAELSRKNNKKLGVCYFDLSGVRSEKDFYNLLAEQVFIATASKWDDIVQNVRKHLKKLAPKLIYSPDAWSEFSLGLDWNETQKTPSEILDLAENICKESNRTLLICIDEFQNIEFFQDSLMFQKILRSHWQHHKNVVYCLYGSKRHMLIEVFTSPSMPFYNFGDIKFLDKITIAEWRTFIAKRFKDTGKSISTKNAEYIANLVDCHPYYVQQLSQQCWLRTDELADKLIVNQAFDELILQMELLFQNFVDSLSNKQINFLRAVCAGVQQLSAKDNLEKYDLGTSGTVDRIKKALIQKDVIDIHRKQIEFINPLFKHWLIKYYFHL